MSQPDSPEAAKARRWRNLALGGALAVFVILMYVITIVHMGGHVFDRAP